MTEKYISPSNGDIWEFYKDSTDEWRWKRKARKGEIVGACTEGYTKKQNCIANAEIHNMDCDVWPT